MWITLQQYTRVVGSLTEGRCAGENAEDLAIDYRLIANTENGSVLETVALLHASLDSIRQAVTASVPAARLRAVTSIPSAIASGLTLQGQSGFVYIVGGEAIMLKADATCWRSLPHASSAGAVEALTASALKLFSDGTTIQILQVGSPVELAEGTKVDTAFVAAAAVALAKSEATNLLRGAQDAPRNWSARLRGPLMLAATTAAVLFLSLGFYFEQQRKTAAQEVAACSASEEKLWGSVLPGEKYQKGELLTRMKKILLRHNREQDANKSPSALSFWGEIASVLPNADKIGMSVDTVQLSSDSGRLSGRVDRGESDPLSNAAQLEKAMNSSQSLTARGEFETKEKEIVVRLNLAYKPAGMGGKNP